MGSTFSKSRLMLFVLLVLALVLCACVGCKRDDGDDEDGRDPGVLLEDCTRECSEKGGTDDEVAACIQLCITAEEEEIRDE